MVREQDGAWGSPGGHLEPEDFNPVLAMYRELDEETGGGLFLAKPLGEFTMSVRDNRVRVHCYLGKLATTPKGGKEGLEFSWFSIDDLRYMFIYNKLRSNVGYQIADALLRAGPDFESIILNGVPELPLSKNRNNEDMAKTFNDFDLYIAPIIERMYNSNLLHKTSVKRSKSEIIEFCNKLGYKIEFPKYFNGISKVYFVAELDSFDLATIRLVPCPYTPDMK